MADDEGPREAPVQGRQQAAQGGTLGLRTGVGRRAVGGQAADVTDADGVAVVVPAVGTHLRLGPALLEGAVGGDDIVVATALPTQ